MTNKPKDGGPAFPVPSFLREKDSFDYYDHLEAKGGMTLRDWFAGQMLVGMKLASVNGREEWFAQTAYAMADAMIRARSGEEEEGEG